MPPVDPRVAAIGREILQGALKIGYRAVAAGVGAALEAVGEITEEADRRVKRGARGAKRMAATGEPYRREEEEDE